MLANLKSFEQKNKKLEAKIQENQKEKLKKESVTHGQQSDYTEALNKVMKAPCLPADVSKLDSYGWTYIRTYLYICIYILNLQTSCAYIYYLAKFQIYKCL